MREGVPVLGRRPHYLRHLRVAQFVRGRAGPARRVAQFARGSAGPGSPDPLFAVLPRGGCLSSREAVPVLGRRPHYLRHLHEAGRSVCERQCRSGGAGRSVCERQCRPWVAGPIIYGTSARPLSQFARGSAGPWSPAPLFTALRRGAGRGRQRHDKTRHFRETGRHFLDSVENSGGK